MQQTSEFEVLVRRIQLLERSQRRLRRSNLVLFLAGAALLVVAAGPSAPGDAKFATVEAQRVVVRNASGDKLVISGYDGVAKGVAIDFSRRDSRGKEASVAKLAAFGGEGQLYLSDLDNTRQIALDISGVTSIVSGAGKGPAVFLSGEGPHVFLRDRARRSATFGSTRSVDANGVEITRPVSSITLATSDRIVWSAP